MILGKSFCLLAKVVQTNALWRQSVLCQRKLLWADGEEQPRAGFQVGSQWGEFSGNFKECNVLGGQVVHRARHGMEKETGFGKDVGCAKWK